MTLTPGNTLDITQTIYFDDIYKYPSPPGRPLGTGGRDGGWVTGTGDGRPGRGTGGWDGERGAGTATSTDLVARPQWQ